MKKTVMMLALAVCCMTATAAKKKAKTPARPPLTALEIVEKVNDHYQQLNKPTQRAFWDDAVYYTGNMEAYKLTGCARWLEYADQWARHNKWRGAGCGSKKMWVKNYQTYGEDNHHVLFADWQICFQTYLDLNEVNPAAHKIARTMDVIDFQTNLEQDDFWWWCDALYMAMPIYSKLYRQTGKTAYLAAMTRFFNYADSLMYDKESHLFYRDGKYIYPAHKTDSGKKDFWARGNGWVLAALAKVMQDIPCDSKFYNTYKVRFTEMAEAAVACQQKGGYWTRSMLDAKHVEGCETSGTALICYALLWGINNGVLDRAAYEPAALLAWKYLSEVALQADGSVGFVQPIGEKAVKGQTLTAASVTNFGTGAFLLAACEKVRYDDALTATAKTVTLTVSNPSPTFRQEVVAVDAKEVFQLLGISGGRQLRVVNALGQEVAYQLTYDGQLLVDAAVRPSATASFTIERGTPRPVVNTVYGRMYPERVDDIAWENDRGSYRLYGPALQRSGEKAFGNDVWLKNTPDLENETRYYVELTNHPRIQKLKKEGKTAEAKALEEQTTYHFDHGHGLDCYKVGPSLGCGAPALLSGDTMTLPYCYKDYEILDNGPLRFTVRLTYNTAEVNGEQLTEHRLLSLDKGSNFNRQTVWYEGGTKSLDIASGVVIHNEDTKNFSLGKDYVEYADPTDNPTAQNFQIYVGVLFPDGATETKFVANPGNTNGIAGHALCIKRNCKPGEKLTYYWGSAWSKYDVRSQKAWQQLIADKLEALKTPLTVSVGL